MPDTVTSRSSENVRPSTAASWATALAGPEAVQPGQQRRPGGCRGSRGPPGATPGPSGRSPPTSRPDSRTDRPTSSTKSGIAPGRGHDPVHDLVGRRAARRRVRRTSSRTSSSSSGSSEPGWSTASGVVHGGSNSGRAVSSTRTGTVGRSGRAAGRVRRGWWGRTSGGPRCTAPAAAPAEGDHPGHQHLDGPLQPEFAADRRPPGSPGSRAGRPTSSAPSGRRSRASASPARMRAIRRPVRCRSCSPQYVLHQLHQRPEHAHLGVRGARALQPQAVVGADQVTALQANRDLPTPCSPVIEDGAPVARPGPVPQRHQQVQLTGPADQGTAPARGRLGPPGPRCCAIDPEGPTGSGTPAARAHPVRVDLEEIADHGHGGGTGHHRARLGEPLQPSGHVEGLADGHGGPPVGTTQLADDRRSAVDADAHGQSPVPVEATDGGDDVERGRQRLLGVVLVGLGPAEAEEDPVAAVPLDVAAEAAGDGDRLVLVGLDQVAVLSASVVARELGRAHEVAEDHGDVAQLGAEGVADRLVECGRRRRAGHRLTAARAEAGRAREQLRAGDAVADHHDGVPCRPVPAPDVRCSTAVPPAATPP